MKALRWVVGVALVLFALTGCRLLLGEASLTIVNSSSYVIDVVNISPVDDDEWGKDWLSGTIDPGYSYIFENIIAGDYDIKVIETGDGYWLFWGIELPRNSSKILTCYD